MSTKKPTQEEVALANKERFVKSRTPEPVVEEETDQTSTDTQVKDEAPQKPSEEVTETSEENKEEDGEKEQKTVNTKQAGKKTTTRRARKPVGSKKQE